MASRSFHLNTEPHVATIGTTDLLFMPEVVGAEFASAYSKLRSVQKKISGAGPSKASSTKHAKTEDDLDTDTIVELSLAMKMFVGSFLLPESKGAFDAMSLPERIMVQLMEWVAELYGGGSGNQDADGGTSTG